MNGYELWKIREQFSLSQADLAEQTGIAQSSISRYETGKGPIPAYIENLIRHTFNGAIPPDPPIEITPEKIREIRNRYQLRQRHFAAMLGLSQAAIHKYERGQIRPSQQVAKKILDLDIE